MAAPPLFFSSFLLHRLQEIVLPFSPLPSNAEELMVGPSDLTRPLLKPDELC